MDQPLGGDDVPCLEHEDREQSALLGPAERDVPGLVRDLEWAEYPEFERHGRP